MIYETNMQYFFLGLLIGMGLTLIVIMLTQTIIQKSKEREEKMIENLKNFIEQSKKTRGK